jgi:hypothetical protein
MKSKITLEALTAKIDKDAETGCWHWTGLKDVRGYGRINIWSPAIKNTKYELAHRASYRLHCGEIPDGMVILHKCDTPSCCNPEHLSIGTQRDNIRDMDQKGRRTVLTGEKHYKATLTVEAVRDIKSMTRRPIEYAELYGVSRTVICNIQKGRNWAHV